MSERMTSKMSLMAKFSKNFAVKYFSGSKGQMMRSLLALSPYICFCVLLDFPVLGIRRKILSA